MYAAEGSEIPVLKLTEVCQSLYLASRNGTFGLRSHFIIQKSISFVLLYFFYFFLRRDKAEINSVCVYGTPG